MEITLNLDQFETVISMQKKILEQQRFLIDHLPVPECVDVKYISNRLGLSKGAVYSAPWMMYPAS